MARQVKIKDDGRIIDGVLNADCKYMQHLVVPEGTVSLRNLEGAGHIDGYKVETLEDLGKLRKLGYGDFAGTNVYDFSGLEELEDRLILSPGEYLFSDAIKNDQVKVE